jgi:hypothetical protein
VGKKVQPMSRKQGTPLQKKKQGTQFRIMLCSRFQPLPVNPIGIGCPLDLTLCLR